MNDSRVLSEAARLELIGRLERQSRSWKLVAILSVSILGAALVMGQATSREGPEPAEAESAAPQAAESAPEVPSWDYQVIRFPVKRPFDKDITGYLTDELNAGAANGWEYVGLLALESNTAGYSGLVAFRRQRMTETEPRRS